jgi:hypothetical protein
LFSTFLRKFGITNVDAILAGDVWRMEPLTMSHDMNDRRHGYNKACLRIVSSPCLIPCVWKNDGSLLTSRVF